MKQGWEIKTIGNVCKVIAGQSPEGKYYNSDGNGMPFYQGKKEYGEKYIGEPTTWTTVITKEAEANDILMSVRAPVGPINFATQKICIGRGLAAIRAGKSIDIEFLFNFLLKHESEIVGNSGAVFNSINKAQIEAIEIPLPPLPEQQRIVAILDEAFAAIAKAKANAQQNLQNAKELFESYLQGVFENKGEGWEEKTIKELTTLLGDGLHGTPKYTIDGEYHFINGNNLTDGVIELKENTKRVSVEEYNKYKKNLTDRTILVSINGTLGNVAFYNFVALPLHRATPYVNVLYPLGAIKRNIMNEAETRAELIDPKLKACGWGVVEGSKILREYNITAGKIQTGGIRAKKLTADYVLVYKGIKLAVVEAKSNDLGVGEGVAQAKQYAEKLKLETTYSTNGKEIYSICMKTGAEGLVADYLTPEELWNKTYTGCHTQAVTVYNPANEWRIKFADVPFEDKSGTWQLRYYQEIAVRNTIEAIANNQQRILLTLATGTGKTAIAFQIAWKLFQTRWNLKRDGSRRPRILFLADRNILADQAFNAFSAFADDALVRIKPSEIKKSGKVPTNGSIFFTIFQTFMSGTDAEGKPAPYFGEYPADYFDFIIIDECHRGGANDESNWRGILEYFSPAVQLGLTATPKRKDNVDTYKYFGEPVYIYSLKEGINDGFLTPFKVKRIKTTLDDYIYTSDDQIIEGEIEEGKNYEEKDFNRTIEIVAREAKRVNIYLDEANQKEKAIIFCANQPHAALVRDLVSQYKKSSDPNYCARVTANDGEIGEQFLREFQDNEKTIPTILTTSQKLSTGVDARNIRNIVLMRPVNSMIEFKQIVGRGTRLFDGKEFFTIYDFVDAYHHFADPEWDGEPQEEYPCPTCGQNPCICETPPPKPCKVCNQTPCVCEKKPKEPCEICGEMNCNCNKRQKIKVKLKDGKEREIQSMISTSFWSADGRPISAEEFLNNLFGELPNLFKSEDELRTLWSNPITRRTLLEKLDEAGFGKEELTTLQKLIDAEKSDLFDVLEYVFNSDIKPMTREARVAAAQATIFALLDNKQKEFIEFVLSKYIETGVEELDQEKLPILLTNKYQSLEDAKEILGDVANISRLFIEFQQHLYKQKAA